MTAFIGLNPKYKCSGSSVNGKTSFSKIGNGQLRKALYMPALVAIRHNVGIKPFVERLQQSGKSKMVIVGAIMRKLIHIIYGVLKSGKPFNPDLCIARTC